MLRMPRPKETDCNRWQFWKYIVPLNSHDRVTAEASNETSDVHCENTSVPMYSMFRGSLMDVRTSLSRKEWSPMPVTVKE